MSTSQSNSGRLLTPDNEDGRIVSIPPERLDEALARLLMIDGEVESSQVRQFREYAEQNRISLSRFWGRLDSAGRIRHSVLAIANPGRTAMVFASHPVAGADVPPLGKLIDYACAAMGAERTGETAQTTADRWAICMAQALLQPEEVLERRAFARGRFSELARLSYLERPVPDVGEIPAATWPDDVTLETWRDDLKDDFLAALNLTYEQTLDCPDLRGMRKTADILDGHRGTGQFDPELWSLLRIDGRPSGMILLNPSPTQQTIELVYFGLAVSARGRGLGRQLLRHGLNSVAGRPERAINLAVDEQNAPAIALYEQAGFQTALRRVALIRPLQQERETSGESAGSCAPG